MATRRAIVSAVSIFTLLMFSCIIMAPLNDADTGFDIVDIEGDPVHFDKPAKYVVTLGVGFTQTAISLGAKERIIGVDHYSTSDYTGNESFAGLRNLGNFYTKEGRDQILTTLVQLEENDKLFQKEELLILAPNYTSIKSDTDGLIKIINDNGYGYKVLMLTSTSATSYDDIVQMINKMGTAMGIEGISGITDNMQSVKTRVLEKVNDEDLSGAKVIHVGSYDPPKVYNKSMLISLVQMVGGENIGVKGSGTNYPSDYPEIVQMVGSNDRVVVFVDAGHPMSASEFKERLGNLENAEVIKMKAEWNVAGPSISDGLQAVAAALYPDHFEWDFGTDGNGDDNAVYLYIGAGIAICVVVSILAYLLIRKG